jgi:hypothetical protein
VRRHATLIWHPVQVRITDLAAKSRLGRARALRQRRYAAIAPPCSAWVQWSVPVHDVPTANTLGSS